MLLVFIPTNSIYYDIIIEAIYSISHLIDNIQQESNHLLDAIISIPLSSSIPSILSNSNIQFIDIISKCCYYLPLFENFLERFITRFYFPFREQVVSLI